MLAVQGVTKHFGGLSVLRDVSFTVPAGSVFGLIGPNGAGKTTLFNLVSGLLAADAGAITFQGQPITGLAPHRIARLGLARTFQNLRLFAGMSLVDNVVVGMHRHLGDASLGWLLSTPAHRARERRARERAHELLSWVGLDAKAQQAAGTLPYGEQRKLELARALAAEPRLLLLDEPVAGMAAGEKTVLMEEIAQIRERGYTVLLIEHDMRFVMGLCDRVAVLNFGQLIAEGTPREVQRHPAVVEAYLGPADSEGAA